MCLTAIYSPALIYFWPLQIFTNYDIAWKMLLSVKHCGMIWSESWSPWWVSDTDLQLDTLIWLVKLCTCSDFIWLFLPFLQIVIPIWKMAFVPKIVYSSPNSLKKFLKGKGIGDDFYQCKGKGSIPEFKMKILVCLGLSPNAWNRNESWKQTTGIKKSEKQTSETFPFHKWWKHDQVGSTGNSRLVSSF